MTKLLTLSLSLLVLIFSGCAEQAEQVDKLEKADVYRHTPSLSMGILGPGGHRDIVVMTLEEGRWKVTATSDEGSRGRFINDARGMYMLGWRNIGIRIGEIGYTDYAGLRFTQPTTVNIWDNGVVQVNREGIEVTDSTGTEWVSKRVRVDGNIGIVFVRN